MKVIRPVNQWLSSYVLISWYQWLIRWLILLSAEGGDLSPHGDIFKCCKTEILHGKHCTCKIHTAAFLAIAFSFSSFHFSHYWVFILGNFYPWLRKSNIYFECFQELNLCYALKQTASLLCYFHLIWRLRV